LHKLSTATILQTVSFSQNGPSEEVVKLSLQKTSLGDVVVNSSLKKNVIGIGVLHSMEHCKVQSMPNNNECLLTPDFDRVRVDSVEPPPGFDHLELLTLQRTFLEGNTRQWKGG